MRTGEVTRVVLHIDPILEPNRARQAFEESSCAAKWITSHGYRHLLRGGVADQEK